MTYLTVCVMPGAGGQGVVRYRFTLFLIFNVWVDRLVSATGYLYTGVAPHPVGDTAAS